MANANASSRSFGSGSLKNSSSRLPRPRLADLRHHLGQHLAADVGVDAPQREAERAGPAAGHCRLSAALNASARTAGKLSLRARARSCQDGVVRPLRRGLADLGDQHLEAAAADVLVRGVQARLGGQQRVGLVDVGQGGEGGVADLDLLVVEQRAQPLDRAGVVQRGHRPADLDAGGLVLLAAQLEQQAEGPGVAQHRQAPRPAQAGVEGPAGRRLEQRLEVGILQRLLRARGAFAGFPFFAFAGGRRLLGGGAFQLGELPVQLRVDRPQGLEQPLAGVQREEERRAADLGVGVLGASAQGRLHGGSPSIRLRKSRTSADRRTSACFDPRATRFASGDSGS